MKTPDSACNNLLAGGATRCKSMSVNSVQIELEAQELAVVERVRALGFSSDAEVIRLATLAWTDRAAQLLAEEQAAPDTDGLNSPDSPTALL